MNARYRPLLSALVVSVALLGAWRWQANVREAREQRKALWMQYLHGPLADFLYGSSRARPLLAKRQLNAKDQAEIKDAIAHLRESAKQARVMAVLTERDPRLAPLNGAAQWHQEVYDLFEPWQNLVGRPLGAQALGVEKDLRSRLWCQLNAQRGELLRDKSLNKDEVLETNAMLYSLQEETEK